MYYKKKALYLVYKVNKVTQALKSYHQLSVVVPSILLVLCLSPVIFSDWMDSTQGQQVSEWNSNITDKGQCVTSWYKNMHERVSFGCTRPCEHVSWKLCEKWKSQEVSVMWADTWVFYCCLCEYCRGGGEWQAWERRTRSLAEHIPHLVFFWRVKHVLCWIRKHKVYQGAAESPHESKQIQTLILYLSVVLSSPCLRKATHLWNFHLLMNLPEDLL